MTTHGRLVSVALVLALATVSSALAQPTQDVQGRLERSSKLQKEALANLGDPARAEVLVRTAHRELKAPCHRGCGTDTPAKKSDAP